MNSTPSTRIALLLLTTLTTVGCGGPETGTAPAAGGAA